MKRRGWKDTRSRRNNTDGGGVERMTKVSQEAETQGQKGRMERGRKRVRG